MKNFFQSQLGGFFTLADGAMGTALLDAGFVAPLESCVIHSPPAVVAVHRGFVDVGSRVLLSNTFLLSGALSTAQNSFGVTIADVQKYAPQAVHLARTALQNHHGWVGLSLAGSLDLTSPVSAQTRIDFWNAVADAKPDFLILETVTQKHAPKNLLQGKLDSRACKIPVGITAVVNASSQLLGDKTDLDDAFLFWENDCDFLGINCVSADVLFALGVRNLRRRFEKMVWFKPNLSALDFVGEHFALWQKLRDDLSSDGHFVFGGCCGTSPVQIRELNQRLLS